MLAKTGVLVPEFIQDKKDQAARRRLVAAEKKAAAQHDMFDLIKSTGSGIKEISIAALQNPFFSMILANVAIEYAQTIKILDHTERQLVSVPDPGGSGMGHHEWQDVQIFKPLISQAHATTMESIINTSAALSGFGISVGDLVKLLK